MALLLYRPINKLISSVHSVSSLNKKITSFWTCSSFQYCIIETGNSCILYCVWVVLRSCNQTHLQQHNVYRLWSTVNYVCDIQVVQTIVQHTVILLIKAKSLIQAIVYGWITRKCDTIRIVMHLIFIHTLPCLFQLHRTHTSWTIMSSTLSYFGALLQHISNIR